jgi:hypothetical protein
VKTRLRDLPRFPLRDHGSPERVERIWRRLAPEVSARSFFARPQAWWAPATLVVVFGAGVFVGARWVRPDAAPVLSAERPPAVEPATGMLAPRATASGTPNVTPRVPPAHRMRATGIAAPPLVLTVAKAAPPASSVVAQSSPPEWERLAEAGDFEAARASLDARGGFDSVLGAASAAQLMTLVDIARASGSRERAVAALRRVLGVFREAPEAPLAAWTLGNLLDQAGDENGASEAYALYRRLSPGGDFAEDALAREVDAALSQGNLELSARLIAQYENEFPNGRSLEEFRSELARRSERAQGTPFGDAPSGADADPSPGSEPARSESAAAKSRGDEPAGSSKLAPKP